MIRPGFVVSALGWLAAMAGISALGPLGRFPVITAALYAGGFLFMVAMARLFPGEILPRRGLTIILALAVIGRILLLPHPPGNDIFRYIWEGHIQNLGFNPYRHAPVDFDVSPEAETGAEAVRSRVNHPELPAIYPPAALLLFRMVAAVSLDPMGFKLVLVGFDLALIVLLDALRRRRKIPPAFLLLYAANPLVLVYIAGEGHLDGVQAFFLMLGIYCIERKKNFSGFVWLGVGAMIKYVALAAIPFLLRSDNWKHSFAALLPLVLFVPFLDAGWNLFHSLGAFGLNMHYNDSIAALLRLILEPHAVLPASAVALAVGWIWVFLFVQDRMRSVFWGLGWLLLCLPTLHPWYLLLLAPFFVFYPSLPWVYLQAAMAFTFPVLALELQTGVFQEIPWLKFFEYGPFLLLILWEMKRSDRLLPRKSYAAPRAVTVIVPTLNENESIEGCLQSVVDEPALHAMVVVDGGSVDDTRQRARALGARVLSCEAGRGIQIRTGIAHSRGDLFLILHADCRLVPGTLSALLESMRNAPDAVGGAFAMRFDSPRRGPQLIALLNNLRLRLTGIAFGDQAQFVRRQVVDSWKGIPSMMLMEDVEISLKLKESGPVLCLSEGVRVSARRWRNDRFAGRVATVLRLFFRYLLKRRWKGGGGRNRSYYRRYYHRN